LSYSSQAGEEVRKPHPSTSSFVQPEAQPEEEFLLLMPQKDACPICESEVWRIERGIYNKRAGVGQCAKCGHISWFGDFSKGTVVTEEDLPLLLYRPIPVEARAVIKISGDGKVEIEGGKIVNHELFRQLLNSS
jgi:hypothetical protein